MTTYIVSRHPGAIAWLLNRFAEATVRTHVTPDDVQPGDTVVGTLPVHLLAALQARGVRCLSLVVPLEAGDRGRELHIPDLDRLGAYLAEYRVQCVG